MAAAGAAGSEQQELLALMHQHLVQTGYERAAKALLQQSGRKTFPSSPVSLQDIFAEWKKTYSQVQKQKVNDTKKTIPAKIRVSDPKSSSESSDEEEAANAVKNKTNLPVNNISVATAETSSEDEDSSSEEEAVAGKVVKTPGTGNKTTDFLQLAAQKTNSFPGKGVAVAAVQAKERQKKAAVSKPLPPSVGKTRQNKAPSGQQGAALQSPGVQRQTRVQAAAAKKTASSESSSSNSSSSTESEEEKKTLTPVKVPPPKSDLKKAESSSEDSSDDSDSEEESQAAAVQVKPAVPSIQVSSTLAKSSPATIALSKASAVKVPPAKVKANQVSTGSGTATRTAEATDSSDTSDSSDSEDEEPSSATKTKLPGKAGQASASLAKSVASNQMSERGTCASAPLKQIPKPPITSLAKLSTPAKKVGSSESSGSSSETENEAPPVPVSQKRLQAPQPPTGTKPNQDNKPGSLVKAVPSALKAKEAGSDSSSTSDSEDEVAPAALKLPPLSASQANMAGVPKPPPVSTSLQEAQQSEDSSQDSSDESDSKEGTVFTQKPAQVTQKPAAIPAKALPAKGAGGTPGKAGSAQLTGKKRTRPAKPAAASLRKASESSETGSSVSSQSEVATKPTNQLPIHPFFKQMVGKGATPSAKSAQANASTPSAISSQWQEPGTAATGKVERSPSKKAKPSQNQDLADKPIVLLKRIDNLKSRSSLDSQEGEEKVKKAVMTTKQIPQTGVPQKQGAVKEAESSSEDSSDDEEPSQSLLAGSSGPSKTPAYTAMKNTSSMPLKQSSGKAGAPVTSILAKTSGKPAFAGISSGDSSDSETDVEEIVGTKAEVSTLPSSGKGTVVAKVGKEATVEKKGPGSNAPKASKGKKATAKKAQSNGKAKEAPAVQILLTSWSKAQPAQVGSESKEEAAARILAAGGQEEAGAAPVVAGKAPKAAKASKSGEKKKLAKKRKLTTTGDTSLGETKGKKLKTQSNPEAVTKKKKKKKKSKTSGDTKTPKKKEGKEKKADKKKKKSKKMESLSEDGLQKKKKKKKKSGDLEGTA